MDEPVKEARGLDGVLKLSQDTIQIRRDPFASLLEDGLRVDKNIPLERVSSVNLEMPEEAEVGCVRFILSHPGRLAKAAQWAVKNSNTVAFRRADLADFRELKSVIESRILKLKKLRDSGSESSSQAMK